MEKKTADYTQGQMMGMLCIIRLLRTTHDKGERVSDQVLDRIERISSESLAGYLQKPEEDVILMVDNQLDKI